MATPIWQTGAALQSAIDAGGTLTIDIGSKVSGADEIEEVFGVQYAWMEWNEATEILTLTDAPRIRKDTNIIIRFVAKNTDGETPADYTITLRGSVFASLHNSLFFKRTP